jgi:hypothetical protein
MRPATAILIWIVLIGGLATYMHSREHSRSTASYELHHAKGVYALEITTTFPVEPDPFALRTDKGEAPALFVMLNGKEILRRTDRVEAGVPIRVDPVPGLVEGGNEFYLEANPPLESANLSYAVRVKLLRDGQPIMERSAWSEPGSKIAATFHVQVETREQEKEHSHG